MFILRGILGVICAAIALAGTIMMFLMFMPGPNSYHNGQGDPLVFIPYGLCFFGLLAYVMFRSNK